MKKWTTESIREFIENDNEYELISIEGNSISDYVVSYKHKKCGYITKRKFHNLLNRPNKCKFCDGHKFIDTKKFIELFNKRQDASEYKILDDYKNSRTCLKVKHLKCGHIFKVRPNDLLHNNAKCPKCSNHIKFTETTLAQAISQKNKNYELVKCLDKTCKCKSHVLLRHKICGTEFVTIAHNFLHNNAKCPCERNQNVINNLIESKKSLIIKEYLDNHNIIYEQEKKFNWLRNKRPLRIDFYIESYSLAIEFDGKQHFTTNAHNKIITPEKVKKIHELDLLKNKLLKEHNIKIVRFSYLDSDEEIINKLKDLFKEGSTTR